MKSRKKSQELGKELSPPELSQPSTYDILGYYASIAGLDDAQRKWFISKLFDETQGEYLTYLYSLSFEAIGYVAQKLLELKEKDENMYNTYKEFLEKILGGYDYYPCLFIGLKEALDHGVKDKANICYVLSATCFNVFFDFISYMKPKLLAHKEVKYEEGIELKLYYKLFPPSAIRGGLSELCDNDRFIRCLNEKLKYVDVYISGRSIGDKLSDLIRSFGKCNAPLGFLKYLSMPRLEALMPEDVEHIGKSDENRNEPIK